MVGQPAESGDRLSMHYVGTIDPSSMTGTKGQKFDSSRDRGTPFEFTLGQGQVIQGWDEGLIGVCIGDKKTLVIPPEKGYGEQGAGGVIPGGATLNFEVEVMDINNQASSAQNQDTNVATAGLTDNM